MNSGIILAILVFYPFLGALVSYMIGTKNENLRDYFADFVTISEFVLMLVTALVFAGKVSGGSALDFVIPEICGLGMTFTLEGFRIIYGVVAALMWMMATLLSKEYFAHHENRNRFYLFLLLTLGATMGVFLSADLFTTFIFFEIMSFTSYVWVAQEENAPSLRAAATYLAVAVLGGLVMLMGLFILYHEFGTLDMASLRTLADGMEDRRVLYSAGVCMLVGFGAKAGAFPLHIWLPKAHPVAPAPASALLSGILTKTGIFGVLVVSCGLFLHDVKWGVLILTIGVLTMFGGALLAVFSIDLKRTLACSSMSQIGFIMVGIGMQGLLGHHNELAVHGTLLHMVNHSMIKLVLFLAAGVIYMNAHALDLNKIRGFGRKKNALKVIFLIGALTIGGIPMFGGYISKTLLHESIVHYGSAFAIKAVEYIFLFSGGLTLAYMTKLFVAIFVEENADEELQKKYDAKKVYMNLESKIALGGSALILFVWGLFPHAIMDKVAALGQEFMYLHEEGHAVHYLAWVNLKGAVISIIIGSIVYLFFIRKVLMRNNEQHVKQYVNIWPVWLDLEDVIYRPLLLKILPVVTGVIFRVFDSVLDLSIVLLRKTFYRDSELPHELPEGNWFTMEAGKILNSIQHLGNMTWNRKKPVEKDYVHILAVKHEELRENSTIIGRSLSFGLLLFSAGLCLTMIYIIWW